MIQPLDNRFSEYLHDESRLQGQAESISFPTTREQVQQLLTQLSDEGKTVTVQGGRTGIAGSGVPFSNHIMNLSRMNRILGYRMLNGQHLLEVEPGITLMELQQKMSGLGSGMKLHWPCDPTETSATVGGIAACNAMGICGYQYGPAQEHIAAFEAILPDGTVKNIEKALDPQAFTSFMGSEGMFGIITRLTLVLQPAPKEVWGIVFFFSTRTSACGFGEAVIACKGSDTSAAVVAAEYLERNAIALIEVHKNTMSRIKDLPNVPSGTEAAIYLELHGNTADQVEQSAEWLMELAEEWHCDPELAWAVSGEAEVEKLRSFRHAAAEVANILIERARNNDSRITKLGTDMLIPTANMSALVERYHTDIKQSGISASIFGHIPGNRLHVNLLPETYEAYEAGKSLLMVWAEEAVQLQGALCQEHGVGKLKKTLWQLAVSSDELAHLKKLKNQYDPTGMLNPHNAWME